MACPNIHSDEWKYISKNVPDIQIAWNVWNRNEFDNLDAVIKEETDKYYHLKNPILFYESKGFTNSQAEKLATFTLQEVHNNLLNPTSEFISKFVENGNLDEYRLFLKQPHLLEKYNEFDVFMDKLYKEKNSLVFKKDSSILKFLYAQADFIFYEMFKDQKPVDYAKFFNEKKDEFIETLKGVLQETSIQEGDSDFYKDGDIIDEEVYNALREIENPEILLKVLKHVTRGILNISSDYQIDETTDEIVQIFDRASYKEAYNNLSNLLKLSLRNIQDLNSKGEQILENGVVKFINPGKAFVDLLIIGNGSINEDVMMEKFKEASDKYPWLKGYIESLQVDESLKIDLWKAVGQRSLTGVNLGIIDDESYTIDTTSNGIERDVTKKITETIYSKNNISIIKDKLLSLTKDSNFLDVLNEMGYGFTEQEYSQIPKHILLEAFGLSHNRISFKNIFQRVNSNEELFKAKGSFDTVNKLLKPYINSIKRNTVLNVKNEKIYPYILPNFITKFFNNLKFGGNYTVDQYSEDSFYSNSPIFDFLKSKSSLAYSIINGLDFKTKKHKIEYGEYKPFEYLTHAFLDFVNITKFKDTVQYFMPLFSDSSSLMMVELPVFSFENSLFEGVNEDHPFLKIYKQELNLDRFYWFTFLNNPDNLKKIQDSLNEGKHVQAVFLLKEMFDNTILKDNKNYFVKKKMFNSDFSLNTHHSLINFSDLKEYEKVINDLKEAHNKKDIDLLNFFAKKYNIKLNEKGFNKVFYEGQFSKLKLEKRFNDFIYSDFIARTQLITWTSGRPDAYKQDKSGSKVVDFFKRNKQVWGAGTLLSLNNIVKKFGNSTYNALFLEDLKENGNEYLKEFTNDLKEFGGIEVTDGATILSPRAYLKQQYGLNKNSEIDEKMYEDEVNGQITQESKSALATVFKPFVFGKIFTNPKRIFAYQLKNSESRFNHTFIKSPLSIEVAKRMGYKLVDGKWKYQPDKDSVDKIIFKSACKVGEFKFHSFNDLATAPVVEMSYVDYMLQQETPNKLGYFDKIGVQIMKLIQTDLKGTFDIDGKKLESEKVYNSYHNILKSLFDAQVEEFNSLLKNPLELKKKFIQLIEDRGMPESFKYLIEKNIPIWFPLTKTKMENLLFSLQRKMMNEIGMNLASFYNASGIFFKDDLNIIKDSDGGLTYEAYLPLQNSQMYKDLMDENGVIDFSKIDEDLKKFVAYRIPTESYYSMMRIKVKGYIPASSGALIYLPKEITKIAGLDFDIDKVFALIYNYNIKDGKLVKTKYLDESTTLKERWNQYVESEAFNLFEGLKKREDFNPDDFVDFSYNILIDFYSEFDKIVNQKLDEIYDSSEEWKNVEKEFKNLKENKDAVANIIFSKGKVSEKLEVLNKIENIDSLKIAYSIYNKLLETKRSEFKTLKNSLKNKEEYNKLKESTKTTFKDIVIQYLEDMGLYDEFKNKTIEEQNTKQAKQNRLLDIISGILGNENISKQIMQIATYENVRKIIEKHDFYRYANKIDNIASLHTQAIVKEINDAGKALIGPIANANSFHSIVNKIDLGIKDLNFKRTLDEDNKPIARNLAELLAMVVDNAKDPLAFYINLNMNTVNVATALLLGGRTLEQTILYINNPILRNFNEQLDNNTEGKGIFRLVNDYKNTLNKKDLIFFEEYIALKEAADELAGFISYTKIADRGLGKIFEEYLVSSNKQFKKINGIENFLNDGNFYSHMLKETLKIGNTITNKFGYNFFKTGNLANIRTYFPNFKAEDFETLHRHWNNFLISGWVDNSILNDVLEEFKTINPDNVFYKKLYLKSNKEPFPRIAYQNTVESNEELELIENEWYQKIIDGDEFALKLVLYSIRRDGFEYTPQTFGHLIPKEILFNIKQNGKTILEYLEELNQTDLEDLYIRFISQFLQIKGSEFKFTNFVSNTKYTNTPSLVVKFPNLTVDKKELSVVAKSLEIPFITTYKKIFYLKTSETEDTVTYTQVPDVQGIYNINGDLKTNAFISYVGKEGMTVLGIEDFSHLNNYKARPKTIELGDTYYKGNKPVDLLLVLNKYGLYNLTQVKTGETLLENININSGRVVKIEEEPVFENKQMQEETTENTKNIDIYSQLGNKTKSENVVIKSWDKLKDANKAITTEGIISTRIKITDAHFGNPFTPDSRFQNLIQVESTKEAVERYINWIITGEIGENIFIGIMPEDLEFQREWILDQLKSGKLKGKPIFYYKELGEPSHATALDYLINKYDWSTIENTENVDIFDTKSEFLSLEKENFYLSSPFGYGPQVQYFMEKLNGKITKTEAEFLKNNEEFAQEIIDMYEIDSRSNGLTLEEFLKLPENPDEITPCNS